MTASTTMRNKSKQILKRAAVLLLWLAVWQLAATAVGKEILIPSPAAAFSASFEMISTVKFWRSVGLSLIRIAVGYLAGTVIGFICGLLSYRFKLFKAVFSPILHLIRAVPVASFIILALVWIKSAYLPVFICFLTVLPIIWLNIEAGMSQIDGRYIEVARLYKFSAVKTFFKIKLPFLLPSFAAAATTALGFAWKSGVAAEVICRPSFSIGTILQDSKLYLEMPQVFAITAVIAIISILFERFIKLILGRVRE